jgi:hypothetical protein
MARYRATELKYDKNNASRAANWSNFSPRKVFETLTRTEDLSQDAGEQLQTKFPPRPHDAHDSVPPPQPQEPRLEDFLDSVDANGDVVKGEFHVPNIVKLPAWQEVARRTRSQRPMAEGALTPALR